MKGVGGISPVPSGQVFETQSHPYNWPLGEVSADSRGLSGGETKLLFRLELVAPAERGGGAGTEIGQPELKPSLSLPTFVLFCRENLKLRSPEQSIQPLS